MDTTHAFGIVIQNTTDEKTGVVYATQRLTEELTTDPNIVDASSSPKDGGIGVIFFANLSTGELQQIQDSDQFNYYGEKGNGLEQ